MNRQVWDLCDIPQYTLRAETKRMYPILAGALDCKEMRRDADGLWLEVGPHGDGGDRRPRGEAYPSGQKKW